MQSASSNYLAREAGEAGVRAYYQLFPHPCSLPHEDAVEMELWFDGVVVSRQTTRGDYGGSSRVRETIVTRTTVDAR